MQRTSMSYMVGTIVVMAALGGIAMQNSVQYAQAQQNMITSPACGQVVSGNVTLTANLVCSNNQDGLSVAQGSAGDHTTINLNGYTITGPGGNSSKVGISVPHSDGVIIKGPGTIENFQAGVLMTGSSNTEVQRLTFQGNKIAVFMSGTDGATIEQNTIGPNTIGVAAYSSSGASVHANLFTGNSLSGITFVNGDESMVDANSIGGSKNGIYLDSQSGKNVILFNNALRNDVDINNADGLPININGNEFTKNNCFLSQPSGICIGE